jgi:hypothetical protein
MAATGGARYSYNPDPAKTAEMIGYQLSWAIEALKAALDAAKAVTDIRLSDGGSPDPGVTEHHRSMARDAMEQVRLITEELE